MKNTKISTKAAFVACLVIASAAASHAQTLIDVNIASFTGNGQAVLGGTSDTYNNFNPSVNGQNNTPAAAAGTTLFANAVSSTGASTGVTITTGSGFNTFGSTGGTTNNPSFLMAGYAYNTVNGGLALSSATTTFTLSNLSAFNGNTFTLVLYGAGNTSKQGDVFTLSGAGTGTGTTTGIDRNISNGVGDAYTVITGTISGSALTITTTSNDTTGGAQGPFTTVNGFQLQLVPEPSTWAMMIGGLGMLVVVARSRTRLQG